jgi:hypothetical protein
MSISDATLSQDVWTSIRTRIVTANPTVVNSATGSTTSASVYASYNDKKATRPQIVIMPIQDDEDTFKFGGTEGRKSINVDIEIYHNTTEGIDQMSDTIKHALKQNDIDGIDLVSITTDYAFTNPDVTKYHLKTVTGTYLRE